MRAAFLTTGVVIGVLIVWSSLRSEKVDDSSQTLPATALANVAAGPPSSPSTSEERLDDVAYATATAATPLEHVVVEGETLASIAESYYGDAARADDIYQANRDVIPDRRRLAPGQRLLIP